MPQSASSKWDRIVLPDAVKLFLLRHYHRGVMNHAPSATPGERLIPQPHPYVKTIGHNISVKGWSISALTTFLSVSSRLVSSPLLLSYPILSSHLLSTPLDSSPLLSSPLQLLQRSQPQTLASAGCMMEEVGHGSRFPYHPCRPASQPQPQRISVFASPRFPLSCCKKG